MKNFTLFQRVRNKIRVKGSIDLDIDKSTKIVDCKIGEDCCLSAKEEKNYLLKTVICY